ncbi:hypothetical protein BDZ89DRAFT_1059423 [Hymenopellis radicata]|nr:hypothetical protein BDZ89DRAFT_1059423 [Hymenopellis radicata]
MTICEGFLNCSSCSRYKAPFPMSIYDDPFGSILLGSWFASMLYMLIIRETISYYTSFGKSDALKTKIFYTVAHWGDLGFIRSQAWPFTLYLITTGITAFNVQCFLVKRCYALAGSYACSFRSVSSFLSVSVLLFGGLVATVILITVYNQFNQRFIIRTPVIVWLISTAVTDILIAAVLIWQLYRIKTSYKTARYMIQRLMRAAMQTGTTTSVIALSVLISYLVNNTSNVGVGICFILGRVYILTLLYNLNLRTILQQQTTQTTTTVAASEDTYPSHRSAAMAMEGIHVQRTAIVHMDTSVDDLALTPSSYKYNCKSQV